jgi:hypothetical protein
VNEGGLDAGTVLGDGVGQLDEGQQPAATSPHQPVVEEAQGAPWLSKMEDLTELCLEEVGAVERLVGLLDSASLAFWRVVRSSGFFQRANRASFSSRARAVRPPRRAAFQTLRRTSSRALLAH